MSPAAPAAAAFALLLIFFVGRADQFLEQPHVARVDFF